MTVQGNDDRLIWESYETKALYKQDVQFQTLNLVVHAVSTGLWGLQESASSTVNLLGNLYRIEMQA